MTPPVAPRHEIGMGGEPWTSTTTTTTAPTTSGPSSSSDSAWFGDLGHWYADPYGVFWDGGEPPVFIEQSATPMPLYWSVGWPALVAALPPPQPIAPISEPTSLSMFALAAVILTAWQFFRRKT